MLQLPKTTKGRVCSEHFLQNDIYVVNGRVFLKNGAVPKRVLVEVAFDNEIEVDEIMPDVIFSVCHKLPFLSVLYTIEFTDSQKKK